jgi:phage I-like protein
MDKKALCAALGLAETATEIEILAAIAKNKSDLALAASAPALDRFVPRADYDTVLKRATDSETALASRDATTLKTEAEALIAQGVTDGKIAPASKDYYLATCATRAGLDATKAFLSSAPKVVQTAPKGDPDKLEGNGGLALTTAQMQVAKALGMSAEDYKKQLDEDAKDAA